MYMYIIHFFHLSLPLSLDPTFVQTFLMTYRSFCKPGELLNLLIERYQIPLPIDPNDQDVRIDPLKREAIKRFKANYVSPIHLRYVHVHVYESMTNVVLFKSWE